jgi:hypothetical protein
VTEVLPDRRAHLEDHFASRNLEQQIWQMVTQLGGTSADSWYCSRECLFRGNIGGIQIVQGIKREVPEKVLPECVARSLEEEVHSRCRGITLNVSREE